jgi:hypothetical protein
MQRSALGCGPLILLLGAQACVGWAGGAARPSRIAPTPRWWPPVRLRMSRRLPDKCRGAGSGLVRSTPRAAASELLPCLLLCHADAPAPLGSRQRAPCCRPPPERLGVGRSPYFCNGFWPAPGSLCSTRPLRLTSAANAPASVTRTRLLLSDRANVHRTAAPISGAARCRPTFVTAKASDTPYTQPDLCASRVPPSHPRRRSACACAPGHAPICRRCLIPLRRPDRSRTAIFCPHIAVPQAPAAKRVNLNPWRLTRSCTASGHAPAAQNCPRSRTRLTPWLRRFSGAANAAGASEAGVLKTQTGERKSFAQS